jgi:hypothetical protein
MPVKKRWTSLYYTLDDRSLLVSTLTLLDNRIFKFWLRDVKVGQFESIPDRMIFVTVIASYTTFIIYVKKCQVWSICVNFRQNDFCYTDNELNKFYNLCQVSRNVKFGQFVSFFDWMIFAATIFIIFCQEMSSLVNLCQFWAKWILYNEYNLIIYSFGQEMSGLINLWQYLI